MTEEKDVLYKMLNTICYNTVCSTCPLDKGCVSIVCVKNGEYTDAERSRIITAYAELYPDGSLLNYLRPNITVTENEIENLLG